MELEGVALEEIQSPQVAGQMPSEPAEPSKDENAASEAGKGSGNQRRASAAALIDAFAKQYQADRKEAGRREGHRIFREWLTIAGLFIAAVVAGLQWRELHKTDDTLKETLVAANRAWIAPLRISFLTGVDSKEGPTVLVTYQNVGRAPALDLRIGLGPIAADVETPIAQTREFPKTPLWAAMWPGIRDTCKANQPIDGGSAAYPSATTENNAPSGMTTPWDKEKILNGTQIIIVVGCFTYRTMNVIGHSGFCNYAFHIAGRPADEMEIRSCPVGSFAE